MAFIILIFVAALMIFLGYAIHHLKWHGLISGYNTMADEDKAKVDIDGLSKMMARFLYVVAALLALLGFATYIESNWLSIAVVIAIVAASIYPAIQSGKYMNGAKSGKSTKLGIGITVVTLLFVGVVLYFSMQPTSISVSDEHVVIDGMYGDTIDWSSIENLQLVDELPAISMRTNGSAVGATLRGHFKFENGDKAKLFVDKSKPPFITFAANDTLYYMNLDDRDATTALFEEMKNRAGN